jgi:3-oxoacyl-[acyl-carrier protein] reductase
VLARAVDVTDEHAVAAWVAGTAEELGGVHIVVSNGGGPPPGPVDTFGLDGYRSAVESTLLPHIGLSLAALPHLRAAGWGRILLVASETARQPIPHYGLSSTVRPGLLGFVRSLAQSLGPGDITVNVLAPGYHDTDGLRRQFGDDADARLAGIGAGIPVGRVGRAADFGAVVAFLASQPASFITGTKGIG